MALRVGLEPASSGSTIKRSGRLSYRSKSETVETTPLFDHPLVGVPITLPGFRCPSVHRHPDESSATVNDHDCLFWSVAVHSSYTSSRQFAYRESCGLQLRATQPCSGLPRFFHLRFQNRRITRRVSALSHFRCLPRRVFAFGLPDLNR